MSVTSNGDDNNESLNKLLGGTGEPFDDFEKEAREGYAQLSSAEAARLRKKTDARVRAEILQRRTASRYWMAAAALLIAIGFSVYKISDSPPEPEALSLNTDQRTAVVSPAPPAISAETTTALPEPAKAKRMEAAQPPDRKVERGKETDSKDLPLKNMEIMAADAAQEDVAVAATGAAHAENEAKQKDEEVPAQPMALYESASDAQNSEHAVKSSRRAAATPQAATAEPRIQASFPGGSDSLCAKVKAQLAATIARFDAILFINSLGAVERVTVLNTNTLNRDQKKAVKEELLKLRGFTLSADPGANLVEYRTGCGPSDFR
jgi:hypothetical protein